MGRLYERRPHRPGDYGMGWLQDDEREAYARCDCPACGKPALERWAEHETRLQLHCKACGVVVELGAGLGGQLKAEYRPTGMRQWIPIELIPYPGPDAV